MKNTLALMVICLAIYGGYALWMSPSAPVVAPPEIVEAKPVPTTATPEPVVKTEVAESVIDPVPEKRLAPAGTYFVIQPITLKTENGVTGIRVGTKVNLLRDMGDTLQVTNGATEFVAKRQKLTNDLDIVAQACLQDAADMAANAYAVQDGKQREADAEALKSKLGSAQQIAAQRRLYLGKLYERYAQLLTEESSLKWQLQQASSEPIRAVHMPTNRNRIRIGNAYKSKSENISQIGERLSALRKTKAQVEAEIHRTLRAVASH